MQENGQGIMIKKLTINKIRHLSGIEISLSNKDDDQEMRHLLLTGKNGSGKTSVLTALKDHLSKLCENSRYFRAPEDLITTQKYLSNLKNENAPANKIKEAEDYINRLKREIDNNDLGIKVQFNCDPRELKGAFDKGEFILAFFDAARVFNASKPKHVEKVQLKNQYLIQDNPRIDFIKYLVDKKVSQSLFQSKGEMERADVLAKWFDSFEQLLRDIFEDSTLKLDFDVDTFSFNIRESSKNVFDFNTMSDGYAAILDIVVSIIMRMEAVTKKSFQFETPGIVIIDELETHLHYELQKKILPFLCNIFPNIQFIISTHSAFIINSISNAVIYDLENKVLVANGLSDVPYEGVIDGYFNVSTLSAKLESKFNQYKELVLKPQLTDSDLAEIQRLSVYLDEIPDYLAFGLTTEYRKLKLDFERREDL